MFLLFGWALARWTFDHKWLTEVAETWHEANPESVSQTHIQMALQWRQNACLSLNAPRTLRENFTKYVFLQNIPFSSYIVHYPVLKLFTLLPLAIGLFFQMTQMPAWESLTPTVGFEPGTCWLLVRDPSHYTTAAPLSPWRVIFSWKLKICFKYSLLR
jgi:hypothetical protein